MSEAYTAWLPRGAFANGGTDRRLEQAVAEWSQRWFADRTVAPFKGRAASAGSEGLEIHRLDEGLALAANADARIGAAGAMLDAAIDARKARPADRRLFDRLAAACFDDLRARLAEAFGLGRDARWRPGDRTEAPPDEGARAFAFDDGDEPLFSLFVTRALEVAAIKSDLRPAPASPPLQPLAASLGAQRVELSALLGRCGLTIAELSGLTGGDVLVLDRDLDAALDLAVDGQVKRGRCSVGQDGERLRLTITQTPNG